MNNGGGGDANNYHQNQHPNSVMDPSPNYSRSIESMGFAQTYDLATDSMGLL